ncbi:hypothetical protein C9374_014031 [Naegleria lovaniensis]|uniref:Ubiquitin-like domain-containing protein n=1 Tax=Naegleria lovaniensis TaxID=51637 RepID=A0AA88KQA1_NAELO|nr:uncharacterized protein C9374_014031 [Naegleria lovaniensis]KAG2389471.1 hypothetical protein C9374_014031 [Naegleria lovaniensis]
MGNSEVSLTFKTLSKKQFQLTFNASDTLEVVKEKVAGHENLIPSTIKLIYQGKELTENSKTLQDLGFNPNISIIVVGKKVQPQNVNNTTSNVNSNTPVDENRSTLPSTKEDIVLSKINEIQQRAENLEKEVQALKDKREELGEKKYAFERKKCDEYLTRCLLDLDGINVDGNEELRKKRRTAIVFIHSILSLVLQHIICNKNSKHQEEGK